MIKIDIDQKLYSFLQKMAIPFVENPNDTLKRLLKIDRIPSIDKDSSFAVPRYHTERQKGPRTNLNDLVNTGLLEDGQVLYMTNYKGEIFEGEEAIVRNGILYYDDKPSSLSKAAKKILEENNYQAKSVRGPKLWITKKGDSVMELWNQYLATHEL